MDKQVDVDASAHADAEKDVGAHEVAPDIAYQRLLIVNVVFIGIPKAGDRRWVLVDAGVAGMTGVIATAAERRFGAHARPAAIILTHGHFDHVGTLPELADQWDVPVLAHDLEAPHLDGRSAYPPPDPTVGGGLMSALSRFYPRGPIDITPRLQRLPADGSVPFLPGWRWLHTPGHTPGHISLWREADRTLVAGDAFVTTKQESVYAVLTQRPELHGPPMYYTEDWSQARVSVEQLATLKPELAVTGHGPPLRGEEMRRALHTLADNFDAVAVPVPERRMEQRGRS